MAKHFFYLGAFRSHTIPQRFNPLPTQNSKDHHERMKEIGEIPPWNLFRIELLRRIILGEQLHSDHGKNVDHDHQHEGEITERPNCTDYNAEEYLHCDP